MEFLNYIKINVIVMVYNLQSIIMIHRTKQYEPSGVGAGDGLLQVDMISLTKNTCAADVTSCC